MKKSCFPNLPLASALFIVLAISILSGCEKQDDGLPSSTAVTPGQPVAASIPKNIDPLTVPADNPMTPEKIALGRHLFFDKALSVDKSTSCGSCHQVNHGFSDIAATSTGMSQRHGTRNAPPLANVAYNTTFTWDGRFKSLEEHAPGPIFNSVEMGNNFSTTSRDTVPNGYNSGPGPNDTNFLFKRLNNHEKDKAGKNYADLFKEAWGSYAVGPDGVSLDHIAKSIACFERTIISTQTDFDRYNNGDQTVLKNNPQALAGLKLFTDVNGANCISCHSGYNFTDQKFHDNGIGTNQVGDKGQFNVTNDPKDVRKFKTPSLRNIALTAPYMHDGRFSTLQDVLANYNKGGNDKSSTHDALIKPLNLSETDMANIIEFLKTLSDNNFVTDKASKYSNPWNN
ncbi:MAG: cytochrome c peroxidase [Ignavibacteriota bacterium]